MKLSEAALRQLDLTVPMHLRDELVMWVERGVRPQAFLHCILGNNLLGAITYGDAEDHVGIRNVVHWLYEYAPALCWGSRKRRDRWPDVMSGLKSEMEQGR